MEAANWQEAKTLRAYIAAVEQQPVSGKQLFKHREWSAWARDQADRLDPLTPSPPSILDTPYCRFRELGHFEVLDENGNIT